MSLISYHKVLLVTFFGLLLHQNLVSSWDFAVTTKSKIIFYNKNWDELTTAAHQFNALSAITFDETEDVLYFNDQEHNNGSLFSLKLSKDDDYHKIDKLVQKTKDELVQGIAYDPLDKMLYWTDSKNSIIYSLHVDDIGVEEPTVILRFGDEMPQGIAIDICRRKIYWTNSNLRRSSIESYSLTEKAHTKIVETNITQAMGIVVDQYSGRIFWVDDKEGSYYTIESAAMDGTDRVVIVDALHNVPFELAVDTEFVYWTDLTYDAVWKVSKNSTRENPTKPIKILNFPTPPKGILIRTNFLTEHSENPECKIVVDQIKAKLLEPNFNEIKKNAVAVIVPVQKVCLNRGDLNPRTNKCICQIGYTGNLCETSLCHNFCVHGACTISSNGGQAVCDCDEGYSGNRCEKNECQGFCLNDGECFIEKSQAICMCSSKFTGRHCEIPTNSGELCKKYCEDGVVDSELGWNMEAVCGNCNETKGYISLPQANPKTFDNENENTIGGASCIVNNDMTKTILIIAAGVILSLLIIYGILLTVRKMYKPLRPKVRKTYVVRRNITPLTCRPATEQQCEITIEDCCNMNICDTPCFDPKVLEQEAKENRKEDKKNLLNHMEHNGDLY